jgi:UDP-N-acetyl-D-mannosaminuronate dehydrogenase
LLYATHDKEVFKYADYILVDINFDVQREINEHGLTQNYDVDFTHLRDAVRDFATRCKPETLILMESTIPPGTTKEIVLPIIKECYSKRGIFDEKILLGHSYERVMPGKQYIDSIQNFYRVYSGINPASEIEVETFLDQVINTNDFPLTRLKSTTASEMSKVLENSYRAMNITFIVEWSSICR